MCVFENSSNWWTENERPSSKIQKSVTSLDFLAVWLDIKEWKCENENDVAKEMKRNYWDNWFDSDDDMVLVWLDFQRDSWSEVHKK